jgi:hypothetical protein
VPNDAQQRSGLLAPARIMPSGAKQFAEKLFLGAFRHKNRLQVIESSFVETLEITSLVPFSANCKAQVTAESSRHG